MSNPNPHILGDEYVYITLRGAYGEHITSTFVNEQIMQGVQDEVAAHYPNFKDLGIADERIAVISGIALRDAWMDSVALNDLSPGDFNV